MAIKWIEATCAKCNTVKRMIEGSECCRACSGIKRKTREKDAKRMQAEIDEYVAGQKDGHTELTVQLPDGVYASLSVIADNEVRTPEQQAAYYIIRQVAYHLKKQEEHAAKDTQDA